MSGMEGLRAPGARPDLTSWLVDEVRALLPAGSVGLYEFRWLVRGSYWEASDREIEVCARAALEHLLRDPRVQLIRLRWPSEAPAPEAANPHAGIIDWADPTDDRPYAAITLSENVR